MSVLTDRADVALKFALQESADEFQAWLARHLDAVDADGNQVICMFAPGERSERVIMEVLAYPHAVIIASVLNGELFAVQLGDSVTPDPEARQTIQVGGSQTVADLMRAFKVAAAANKGDVSGVRLEFSFASDRTLVLT